MKRIIKLFAVMLTVAFIHGSLSFKAQAATGLEADVVVIGSGVAGMSAGMVALQKGAAKVIVIEKQSSIGANSSRAGGMLYTPIGTIGYSMPGAAGLTQSTPYPKSRAK